MKGPSSAVLEMDPRIELVAAVELLAKGPPCAACPKDPYLDRIRAALPSGHKAVALFKKMTPGDWRHRHPSLIILDFGPPPALEIEAHPEHYEQMGSADALAGFLPALRDFAREAKFMAFFKKETPRYEALLAPFREEFDRLDYLGPLADYLGLDLPHRYHFIMAPLYHGGSIHNVLFRRKDGICDIYSITGHHAVDRGGARLAFASASLAHTAWHEVAHTVVDGITQEHRAALEPLSPLYGLMTNTAKNRYQGPQGWLHIVDEHVIRSLTSRLTALTAGEAAGLAALKEERAEGFALIGPVYEALREYEGARARYPTIREFYPRLIEVLSKIGRGVSPGPRGSR